MSYNSFHTSTKHIIVLLLEQCKCAKRFLVKNRHNKSKRTGSYVPFQCWQSALQIHGSDLKASVVSGLLSEMREALLHHTQGTMKELTELSEKFEMD